MSYSTFTCPSCGQAIADDQQYCSDCGEALVLSLDKSTVRSRGIDKREFIEVGHQSLKRDIQPPEGSYRPQMMELPFQPGSEYIPLIRDDSRRRFAPIGRGAILIICLLLIVLGSMIYIADNLLVHSASGSGLSAVISRPEGNNSATIKTTRVNVNETVTYASVNITILSVEAATSFDDDPTIQQSDVVRVNVREQNPGAVDPFYEFGQVARLVMPDGEIVAPGNTRVFSAPANGVTQTNWIDFPVSAFPQLDQLTLRLGSENESQIDVPLNGRADLSKYQDKITTPNAQTQYAGMTWTIVKAVASLSNEGRQAVKGMRYIVLTLKITNPASNTVPYIRVPGDYVRLKSGAETVQPSSDTLDVTYPSGTVDKTGTATFEVPQGSDDFTLVLLAGNAQFEQANQSLVDFRIA